MSRYDEDLYENPFFVYLEASNADLFGKASSNRWLICIPKFSLLEKEKLGRKDLEDHILVPDPDHDGRFTTVSKHNVTIQDGHINLGAGFKDFKQIEILFEEVFYNTNDESYRVLCVGDFFNRESSVSTTADDSVWAKPPATYDECLRILWSRAGSGKTKEHVDKALLSYCAAYQKYEGDNITSLADLVSTQITGAMQIILKDQNIRRSVGGNEIYMVNLKVAAETYIMNATHKHLFSTITACVKSDDAIVNKMTRNLTELRLHHLGVRREFDENLPAARKELSGLNQFSTPLGRVLCIKRVMTALTRPLPKAAQNEGLVMTTDDFLPLLIYLIIKSQINNWTANLMYMKFFQQARLTDSDLLGFYLTTTEAALDYIKSGEIRVDNSQASPQKVAIPVGSPDQPGLLRQTSGGTSAKSKFFQYVQFGDEAAVTLMLKKPNKDADDTLSQLCHPLCSCEKCADIVSRSKLRAREVSVLSRDDMGRTALHIAAFYGQAGLIDILVKNGSLPDASDYLGCTPLHLACQKGFQNIILLLVHFGSDIGVLDNEGNTPLHLCAKNGHEDCVKAILFLDILKSKLNVNAQNDMGDTPLHMAAKWGYEGIVKFLLETEADARTRNRKRQTPLSLAQNPSIKRMLQSAFDDPPPIIVRHPQPKKPSKLSIRANPSSKTSKSVPSASPSTTILSQPKPHSASSTPSKVTQAETSPAVPEGKTPMGFEVVDVKPRPAKELIDNSSSKMMAPKTTVVTSLDKIDYKQIDKLFTAISNKDIELVKFYLGWVDSPEVDDEGSPRLGEPGELCHPLCQCSRCQPLQKISCSTSLHVNCCNKKGFSPLHIAVIENYMLAFRLFLRKGANVNQQTQRNITPLHLACFHNNTEMVKMLVHRGADVNLEDHYGEIPLHLAAATNNVEIVQILIKHDSTVNLANIDGNTALHRAAASNAVEVLQLLMENGADPSHANKHKLRPFNVTKNKDIHELLLAKQSELQTKTEAITDMQAKPRDDTQLNERVCRLQGMLTKLEGRDLGAWQTLGESIRAFPARHTLKRSQTFSDHSRPVLDTPDLKLSLSIKNFNKEKTLRRQETTDKSTPYLKPFKHSMSIQHFDSGTLKHVNPVDKSSPMHIYSLAQSPSSYSNYLDTPTVEGKDLSFRSDSDAEGGEWVGADLSQVNEESRVAKEDVQEHINEEHGGEVVNETEEDMCDKADCNRDSEEIQESKSDTAGMETSKVDNNETTEDKSELTDNDNGSSGNSGAASIVNEEAMKVKSELRDNDQGPTDKPSTESAISETSEGVDTNINNTTDSNKCPVSQDSEENLDKVANLQEVSLDHGDQNSEEKPDIAANLQGITSDDDGENDVAKSDIQTGVQGITTGQGVVGIGEGDQRHACDVTTDKCDSTRTLTDNHTGEPV